MSDTTELLPCPFCGSAARIDEPEGHFDEYRIVCEGAWCSAMMDGYGGSRDSAIQLWNRRELSN